MLAQDLNPIVLTIFALFGVGLIVIYLRRSLNFEDTTVEAVDTAPDTIDAAELRQLLVYGDTANDLLHALRQMAIQHFEADPEVDAIAPDKVFHLGNTAVSKPKFEEYVTHFEGFLMLTRKYKLTFDQKTQKGIQKIYFAWDPGGNSIQVNTGQRLWTKDVRPSVEKLLEGQG